MDLEVIEQKRAEHHANYKANKLVLMKRGWHGGSTIRHVESRQQKWQRWDIFDPNATPELSLILRCDVDGSLEAISNVLDTYYCDEVKLNLLDFDIGPPTELNVEMAEKLNATIVCFNVNIPSNIRKLAEEKKVGLEHSHVIYELVNRLKDLLSAKLPPMDHYKQLGEGHVLKEFLISVKGDKRQPVAGTRIDSGVFEKGMVFRFTRPGSSEVLYEGSVESLKKEKDFVERAALGAEVGIAVPDKDVRFETDDIVECFEKSLKDRRIDWEPPGF
uniref:Translation initiation factor IF- 2 domain-containing protein n=1 Tax=Ditylenchus dipsaci TaxID=166011 RepID=A0A915DIX7_9BILA